MHKAIKSFSYPQAPSMTLCESILDLHFDRCQVVQFLMEQAKLLSEKLVLGLDKTRESSSGHSPMSTFEQIVTTR